MTEGYRSWWSYVPHFIGSPGYVYAYAYGQLLALAVYGRYEEQGESFVPAYLELLEAGGSRSPEELGQIVGVDLADPGFWDRGLDIVERQLDDGRGRRARGRPDLAARDLVGEGLAAVVGHRQRAVDQRHVELAVARRRSSPAARRRWSRASSQLSPPSVLTLTGPPGSIR